MAKRRKKPIVDVVVKFKKVTFGAQSVSIPIEVDREDLNLEAAEGLFVARRVTCTIIASTEDPKQTTFLDDDGPAELSAVAEVKSMSVKKKSYGTTLNFMLDDVDQDMAIRFANRQGKFAVTGVEELDDEKPAKDDEDEE